jgi:hypothetical protein
MQDVKDLLRYIGKEVKHELWPEKTPDTKYSRYWTIGISVIIVGGGGWYLYRGYMRTRNEAAFGFLSDYVQEYGARRGQKIDWTEVAQSFSLEADRYTRTAAAPYFKVYEAEQLVYQGKKEEALEKMQAAVAAMPAASSLFYMYKITCALMQLDLADQRERGIAALAELAHDEKNYYRDAAAYQLGLYYWIANDQTQAKTIWQELIDSQQAQQELTPTQEALAQSPWIALAKEKLAQIE